MKSPTVITKTSSLLHTVLLLGVLAFAARPASANTELWIGVSGTSVTTNWSDNANWNNVTGGGNPGPAGNDVVFGDSGVINAAGTVNSVVDANLLNPNSLTFTNNSGIGNFHTVLIPDNITMTNANALTVGIRLSPVTIYPTTVGFVGGGTLFQTGTVLIDDSMTSTPSGGGQTATLDLSGLTNFIMTNASATLTVAGTSTGSEARNGGLLNLASATNLITASAINVALGTGNGGPGGVLNLGTGTNLLNVGTISLAAGKINNATMKFLGATGGLRIRGATGTDDDRNVTITLGNRSNSGTGTPTGVMDFTGGHPVNVKVNSATVGRSNQAGAGAGGILLDTGVFDATTMNLAVASSTGAANGTNTVNGGFLVVSNMSMVNQTSTGTGTGILNVSGAGTVIVSNSIVKTTVAGVGNINMAGGTLVVGSNVGMATNVIDTLSVANSTLTLPAKLTPAVFVATLTATGTTNTINVTSVPGFFAYPVQFPLISYTGVGGDNNTFTNGTLPGGFIGYISNNVANFSIDLVITNGPALATLKSIRWAGSPTGDWTTNVSVLNWLTNSTLVNYNQGDTVTFDDTLTGTPNVNLTQTLTPTMLTVSNSTANYVFSGIGRLSGPAGLTKTGTGTLTIDNNGTNDFSGAVTISAGTVQIGNNDANGNLPGSGWASDGTVAFSRSDNLTLTTVINGNGSLVQRGNGKLTLNVSEPYFGNTIVSKGTLALGTAGAIPNTAGIYAQGGTFDASAIPLFTFLNPLGLSSNANFVVGTNEITMNFLNVTNSTITLAASTIGPSLFVNTALTTDGTTNYINVTSVAGVPDSPTLPFAMPIINYGTASFVGGFKFVETNFPYAYVTNNTVANTIDLVLTAAPYAITWNGGSTTGNNWTDSNNWNGIALFAGDNLFFDGSTRLTPFNDLAANSLLVSNITFNAAAGAFTLTGNPVLFNGGVNNNSGNPQTILMGLDFNSNVSLNGTVAPLIIGGGLTNTFVGTASRTVTVTGTGILTNLLGGTGTNLFNLNDGNANWTLMDNASSTTIIAPWAFGLNNGTFNFGSATSAPKLVSTSPQGVPQDDQLGGLSAGAATLNFSNGVFTTSARFNTGTFNGSVATINQYGGTFNIANQFQGANQTGGSSTVNLFGGTMNIGVSPVSTNSSLLATNFGTFFVASRGNGILTITNSALLNCGVLDVSRSINGSIPGLVNLDGGTIVASSVNTSTANQGATPGTATFYFNGGTLKARANSATFFQGRTTAPITPINAYVTARGAIIDSDTNTIAFLEPLLTDPNLLGAADGGLKKFGTGTLTMAGTNTYVGNTLVGAGTLIYNGQGLSAVIVSNSATLGGNGVVSNVTVNAGGTLAPGANGIGVLTVSGDVSLVGTTTMEVDKVALTNDLLLATNTTPSTITYGGTLNVVTTAGALAPGDTFKLFSASNYVGSFTTINPASVTWNTSNLNVDGTLTVVSVAPSGPTTNASITKVTLSGTNLVVHGTNNNVPNNTLHYVVLTSTNILTPLGSWTPVVTNTYNADGTFDYTSPIVPGTPQQFIDVKAAP